MDNIGPQSYVVGDKNRTVVLSVFMGWGGRISVG